jgi:cystathionine gamma-synthase
MYVTDISALSKLAGEYGALLAVDNTLATPYLQQPLDLGADFVLHSTTKYLGGHSDILGGALVTRRKELQDSFALHQGSMGAVQAPFDAWLTIRGIKTLGIRVRRQSASAQKIADFLQSHDQVKDVMYPGLTCHPSHHVASKQMKGLYGGVVSFSVHGGEKHALDVCRRTRLFMIAESLGAVESLISHPAKMTHASAAGSQLAPPSDLIRLSIGLEDPDDLISDLQFALSRSATE